MTEWKCRINGEPVQTFSTKTSIYGLAVAAALAMLDYIPNEERDDYVEIWNEEVMPEYGPYLFGCNGYTIYSLQHPAQCGRDALIVNASYNP